MCSAVFFVYFVAVMLVCVNGAPKTVSISECKYQIDLVYVVDGSDSIGTSDYNLQRSTLAEMITSMDIGPTTNRVGIVVYSTTVAVDIPLSDKKGWLVAQAKTLRHPRDGTVTDLGIQKMIDIFEKHGRPEVPWVCIVITDGQSKYPDLTAFESKRAKDMGINMFAVGISNSINRTELADIASAPGQNITLDSFDKLQLSLKEIMKVVCPCPDPPMVLHGFVDKGKRSIGSNRTYGCEPGYQPMGSPKIMCSKDAVWTTLEFSCEACPDPPREYGNAFVTDGLLLIDAVREYTCAPGYTAPKRPLTLCIAGDTGPYWQEPDGVCTACPQPPMLEFGYLDISTTDTLVGSTRRYYCDKGFIPSGPIESTCIDDKGYPKWTKPAHGCRACIKPPVIPHAIVDKKGGNLVGEVRYYKCLPGYHPSGPIEAVCMGENGAAFWRTTKNVCQTCKRPPRVPNAKLQKLGDDLVGSVRTYLCRKGFQPTGPIEVKCIGDAGVTYWDGPDHKCVACIPPPIYPNAILDPNGDTLVGTVRRYKCMDGFIPSGPIEVGCIEGPTGPVWTPPNFNCIACTDPPPVPYAILDPVGDNLVGVERFYKCMPGYIPSKPGPVVTKCIGEYIEGKGKVYWSEPSHYCKACPLPPPIDFALIEKGDQLIGSERRYICKKGFYATGPIITKCTLNGTWTLPDHSCTACGPLPMVDHADAIDGLHTLGTVRRYVCRNGYVPNAPPEIICLKDAIWAKPGFKCVACKDPYGLDYAVLEPGNTLVGDVRRYTCLPGYLATGPITSTCAVPPGKALPDWSTPVHYCKDCGDPYPVKNAIAVKGQSVIGAVQQYICNKGYVPSAPPLSHCMPNAEWTPPEFKCIACGRLPTLEYAQSDTVGNSLVGTIRSYVCEKGYVATGPMEIVCEENQTSVYQPPTWKKIYDNYCRDCGAPPNVSLAYWLDGPRLVGATAQYVCVTGYVPSAPPATVCRSDGIWETPAFTCGGCTVTPDVLNAIPVSGVTTSIYKTGSVITYECVKDYVAVGIPQLECTSEAIWSPKNFHCERTCYEPTVYTDAVVVTIEDLLVDDIVEYRCKDEYKTVGDPFVTCLPTGQWSTRQFECVTCSPAPDLLFALPPTGDAYIGSVVTYTCQDGYAASGPITSVCRSNLTWSDPDNYCYGCAGIPVVDNTLPITGQELMYPIGCAGIPGVDNTLPITGQEPMYPIGTKITYECIPNYRHTGAPVLECLGDGTWSKRNFQCILSCGPPMEYKEAVLEPGSTLVGESRQYACVKGLKTDGDPRISCLKTGEWSPRLFKCLKCKPAPELEYAVPLAGESYIGSEVTYQCKEGFLSQGPVVSVCQLDLTWSKPANVCYDCGNPPAVPNAYFKFGASTIGSSRQYSCEADYDMSGNGTVVCLPTGVWSEIKFTCYVRTTTTTTTPAPKIEDPSVCDGCRMINGVGYIRHPTNCTHYVQCFYSASGGIEAVYMPCPFGQFWDQEDLTCKPSEDVDCPMEPCLDPYLERYPTQKVTDVVLIGHVWVASRWRNLAAVGTDSSCSYDVSEQQCLDPYLEHYPHTESDRCCAYWTCVGGKSVAKCCGSGYRFHKLYGCMEDPDCMDECPDEDLIYKCDKRPLLDKTRYEQYIGNNYWIKMPCAPGTAFSSIDCECTLRTDVIPGYACRPELLLDFDDDSVEDVSGKNVYIANEGVTPYKGAGYFNGRSRLIINRFSNTPFRDHLVIKLRYKEQLIGPTAGALQALISNGDCGDDPTVIVAKMPGYVLLGAKTDRPKSFALPTIEKEWKEVIYIHDEQKLEGKVCGASYNKYSWGPIKSTHCGIQIGHGTKLPNFIGLMDDITLFQCRPDESILSVYGTQRATFRNMPPPKLNVH